METERKIRIALKGFLGMFLLAFLMEVATTKVDSFLLSVLIKLPFWIVIFIWFDWKEWVIK